MLFVTDAAEELQKLEISVKDIELEKKPIARGGFGQVYNAMWGTEKVVVKVINIDSEDRPEEKSMNEAILTFRLQHKNVIKVFGITRPQSGQFGIVMELAEHGSLDKWIGKINQVKMTKIALGIVDGLEYVHSRHVIHRDIKPKNIVMFGPEDGMIPKIADFGVSKLIQTAAVTHSRVGQDLYMAPEVKMLNRYSFPADIFSLAMTLFEMFNEQLIQQSSEEVMQFIVSVASGRISEFPQSCKVSGCLLGVIKRGWNDKAVERPPLSEYRSALEG